MLDIYRALLLLRILHVLTGPTPDDLAGENHDIEHIYNISALYSARGTLALRQFLNPFFEEFSCMDFISGVSPKSLRQAHLLHFKGSTVYKDIVSGNSTSSYKICMDGRKTNNTYSCIINQDKFCDGYSSCLLDECGCQGRETFLCANRSGCIALNQVCDSRPDCLDASDECICASFQSCRSSVLFDMNYMKLPFTFFKESCFTKPNCSKDVSQETIVSSTVKNIIDEGLLLQNDTLNMPLDSSFDREKLRHCAASSSSLSFHCKNMLTSQPEDVAAYNCSDLTIFYPLVRIYRNKSRLPIYQGFCDGVKNCANGIDEQNCPNTFYCKSDNQPVPMNKTCDTVPDCFDSSDECYNCTMSSYFASSTQLIGSRPVLIIVLLLAASITPLNLYAVYFHQRRPPKNTPVKIDKILCLSLAVSDLLMGVYLLLITIKHFQFSGSYCNHDYDWRSSAGCKIAGALHFAAPHGALQITLLTSVFRSYTCRNSMEGNTISFKAFLGCFFSLALVNFAMTAVPFAASIWPSALTDMFVHEFYFPGNPIIQRGKKADLAQIVSLYLRRDIEITEQYSVKELLTVLQNMTSSKQLFSYEKIITIGYYGGSSMCNPDIFSDENSIFYFKLIYSIETTISSVGISISYVMIWKEYFTSLKAVKNNLNQDGRQDDKTFFLTMKVVILVGSQLFCWIPVNVAIIVSFFGFNISPIINDIMIGIIIPVNSLINPVIHTDILNKFVSCATKKSES
ncbi:hypothetical protein ACHWQZ_G016720 [Mnemiopsis leidyi]